MNRRLLKFLISVFMLFTGLPLASRNYYQFGFLPSVNLNKGLGDAWNFTFRVESQQLFASALDGDPTEFGYRYFLTNTSFSTSRKIGAHSTLSGGYLMKFKSHETDYRFIQHVTMSGHHRSVCFKHRICTDQTFSKNENPEFRLRYRITTEIPFRGNSIDQQEFYFKLNNECLQSIQNRTYDLEIRIAPLLGYEFLNHNKVECGFDYRLACILADPVRNNFWFSVNWQIGI